MSIDISRQRFNPLKDFSGVLMQQGRVQLDSDWNDFVEILGRRSRAGTTDIVGRCVVPRETPDGFKITVSGANLSIGPGRIYVDGLLAENHGASPFVFDPVLAELRGGNPVFYSLKPKQPYLPSLPYLPYPPALPTTGTHLVYIDVWEREVTFIQDPDLVEKAVGVDTTARLQTVWQVKFLPNVGPGTTCDGAIQAWNDLIAPSAGRLSTDAKGVPLQTDPCLIPPTGGYQGLENQTYRVEIHEGGPVGTATFKWSRENASVATNINGIVSTTQLKVDSVGRDSVLGFTVGGWIEITDDARELAGQPGIMRKVTAIAPDTKSITFSTPLVPNELPDVNQNARITRWDHSGKVFDANNNPFFDLDGSASHGVIPVPGATTTLRLENGVEVTFSVDPAGGIFHTGDYWVFAARSADASVEKLIEAAPRGIHHHFGRLAIVTFPGPVSDCRVLWPPEDCCDCTVCVTPKSHNERTLTIQQAIDKIKNTGGTVCLAPGLYNITSDNPVTIAGARSIRLKGHSWSTILLSDGTVPGITVSDSLQITVEDLAVATMGQGKPALNAFGIRNSAAITLQRTVIALLGGQGNQTAIALSGFVIETRIRENVIYGANGISRLATAGSGPFQNTGNNATERVETAVSNLTALLRIDDNFVFATGTGIGFDQTFFHLAENRVAGNFISGSKNAGIAMRGMVPGGAQLGSRLDIHGNFVSTAGHGIVISTSQTRINNNDVSSSITSGPAQPASTSLNAGILLTGGGVDSRIDQCQILENRINQMGGVGISMVVRIGSAMIKQNMIDGAGRGGIVMDAGSTADVLTIENNQVLNIATEFNGQGALVLGIGVARARQSTIAGNTIIGVGPKAIQATEIAGIQVVDSISARIAGNTVYDVAPEAQFSNNAEGIFVLGTPDQLDVFDNEVRRNRSAQPQSVGKWHALRIAETRPGSFPFDINITALAFRSFNNAVQPVSPPRRTMAVRGNFFEAFSLEAVVDIVVNAACLFSDNRCLLLANEPQHIIARVTGSALVVNANYFQGRRTDSDVVVLDSGSGPFTVVGNMASGRIVIFNFVTGNSPLPDPWTKLNVYNL